MATTMHDKPVCPYYGKNEDYCDVGCGYIFPHDVNLIIRFCSGKYSECPKFQELLDRFPVEAIESAIA